MTWIKCTDKLPEKDQRIIFFEKDGDNEWAMWMGLYTEGSSGELDFCDLEFITRGASHWMTIPPIPKERIVWKHLSF